MQNKKRKLIVPACLSAALAATAVGVPFVTAYLTDEETTTNTVTVGEVKVDLKEENYPGNDSDKVKEIVPNEEIPKDPSVHNTGENTSVNFIEYFTPVESLITAAADGTRNSTTPVPTELFLTSANPLDTSKTPAAVSSTATFGNGVVDTTNWLKISEKIVLSDGTEADMPATGGLAAYTAPAGKTVTGVRRVYGYKTPLAPNDGDASKTVPLFTAIKLANVIEGQIEGEAKDLVLNTYAIQAEYIDGITKDTLPTAFNDTQLKNIYDVYVKQNGTTPEGGTYTRYDEIQDAATSNKHNLTSEDQQTENVTTATLSIEKTALHPGDEQGYTATVVTKVNGVEQATPVASTVYSSNPNVVEVISGNKIKAIHNGNATIILATEDGAKSEVAVTVTPAGTAVTPTPNPEP